MTSHGGIVVPDVMGAVSECQECPEAESTHNENDEEQSPGGQLADT